MISDLNNFNEVNTASRKVALLSFLVGTLILTLYFITHYHGIIYLGLFFITAAFMLNSFFTVLLLYFYIKEKKHRKIILFSILLIFINIPIGFFYLDLGFEIYNHIEIVNE
jgi:drug/metabolite transporter (DMT)-like permease